MQKLIKSYHILTKFKKYLPLADLDFKWGLVIHDIGHTKIPKNSDYPSKGHPGTHMFSWESGRILREYHFVLITEGQGVLEKKETGIKKISAGDGFLLFPGEWHRYKPLREVGWTENWVGFSGDILNSVMQSDFFSKDKPIIKNCANMLVQNLFKSLFQLIADEPFGYQRMASGVCLQLMAEICNIQKSSELSTKGCCHISKAKYTMHKKINESFDVQSFCKNHRIGYSKFRSNFKHQTGFAPLQYFLLLKIEKAKDLLKNTDTRSKQIAYILGFKSEHYFGRIFKMKTGFTPQQFRKMN